MMYRLAHSVVMALGSLFLVGCSGGESRISLLLTDAPGDVRAAMVTIDQIYLQPGDSELAATDAGEPGRVVLRDQPITTDLITLANDTETLVDDSPVPSGSYSQLRFVIGGAAVAVERAGGVGVWSTPGYAELPEGEPMGELKLPSWSASGFKVKLPDGNLSIDGEQHILLVDFDVARSLGPDTGAGDLVMHPVIEATDFEVTGSLLVALSLGDVDPALLDGASAVLHDRDGNLEARVPLAIGNGLATARFVYLDPRQGAFTLTVEDADGLMTSPELPLQVDVTSGETSTVDLEVTGFRDSGANR